MQLRMLVDRMGAREHSLPRPISDRRAAACVHTRARRYMTQKRDLATALAHTLVREHGGARAL
eukprot:3486321-Pleurochrysis_carterae.AAC.1